MMKKIFALVLLLVLGKLSYSQYPLQQNLGSDSTIVISKGALQSRLINVTFTDTTQANTQRIRQYPGAQIATTAGGINLWVRNATATAWVPVAVGSGNNIYTIDGTLTGNRTLSGGGNSLTFTGLSQFLLSVGNQTFTVKSDSATLTKRLSYTTNLGSTFKMYSLVDKNYVDSAITASPAGTVTQVNTNNNTGITGGPITSTGTLAIDTLLISTRAWRQKGVDSLQANINLKLNIVDTTGMLAHYFNSVGYGLGKSSQTVYVDSASLSNYYLRRKDSLTATNPLGYVTKKVLADTAAAIRGADAGGTVTSVATNNLTGITGGTITTSGTLSIDTTLISTRAWRQKGVDSVAGLLSGYVPTSRTLTINGTTQDLSANRTYNVGTVTSVGLTMPAAFNVAGSPVTSSGTLAVTGAGLASQYIRGDGTLANFPGGGGGGGSSVSYYLNGSVNQGTFVGNTYYQMSKTANTGASANFTIGANGYIAQFITDAGDPSLLSIPAGNWNFELYFSASSAGGNPQFYVELYKYNGTAFTLISSGSTSPESITGGTVKDLYISSLSVPATSLTITDRLAVRIYIIHDGRTITLYTQNGNLCQIITTFTTGITALNSLTAQVQYLTTGTSGTDFNISSVTDTHTFNLPVASATNTGKLSSTDWSTFNNKVGGSLVSGYITKATGTNTIDTSQLYQSSGLIGIGTTSPTQKLQISGNAFVNGQLFAGDTALSVYQVEGILNTPYVLGRKAVNNTLSTEARPTGVMGHVVGRGSIANRLQAANFYTTTDSASTANSTGSLRSVNAWTAHNGSGSLTTAWGSYNIVQNKTTGTITNAYGSVSGVENRGATSTINKLHGTTTEIWNNYGGTIDTAFGQVISIYNNNAASNIGAVYGLSIGKGLISASGGTHYWRNSGTIGTSYGLYLDSSIDVGTTKYALFSNSNSNSYFRAKLGVGTTSPDSAFQVATGAYFQRGIRASGLPQAAGTKALRIDANGTLSVADTLVDAGGTVTSVATNNGTGITGGTITTTGTLAIDTLLVSTRAWRQKGIDSVQANLTAGLATKLNISDTAAMLSPYARTNVVNAALATKLNISDTASMLNPYLRKVDTTAMLSPYKTFYPRTAISLTTTGSSGAATYNNSTGVLNIPVYTDAFTGTVTSVATNTGTGITGGTITTTGTLAIDTLLISTRAWRQKGVDSLQANINQKLNISDTASMLSPYLRSNVAAATYVPQTRTITINGTSQDLSANRTYNVGTVTSVATNTGTGITGGTITSSGTIAADTLLLSTRAWRQKGIDSVAALINSNVSGTSNYVAKFTGTNTIGNSQLFDNGTNVGIGTSSPSFSLDVATANARIRVAPSTTTNYALFQATNAGNTAYLGLDNSTGGLSGTAYALNVYHNGAYPIVFSTSGTNRMWLDASGNLGLGTSSPTTIFEAQKSSLGGLGGIISVGNNAASAASNATSIGFKASVDFTSGYYSARIASVLNSATPTDNYLAFYLYDAATPAGTEKMRLNSSGNLGLGVSPSATAGGKSINIGAQGYAFSDGVSYQYNSGFANNAYVNGNGTYAAIVSRAAGILEINESSFIWKQAGSGTAGSTLSLTSAMTLFSTGNLAVGGTSDNGSRLQVTGAATFSSSVTSQAGGQAFYSAPSTGTNGSYLQFNNNGSGTIIIGQESSVAGTTVTNSTAYSGLIGTTSGSRDLILFTGGVSRLTINSTGAATFSSSVTANGDILANGSSIYTKAASGGYQISLNAQTSPMKLRFDDLTGSAYGSISFQAGNGSGSFVDRLTIATSGNVGIGTTSPDSLLTVQTGAWVKRGLRLSGLPTGTGTKSLRVDANGTVSLADTLANGISGTGTTNYIPKFTSSSAIGNSIVQDNSTGIVVAGTDNFTAQNGGWFFNGSGSYTSGIFASSSSNNLTLRAPQITIFESGGSERMRLDASGNLGINTSSPTYKLDVNGSFNFTTGGNYLTYNSGILYHGNYYQYPSGNNYNLFARASGALLFGSNDTERMRLDASGNLGLGTSSPAAKLHVAAAPVSGTIDRAVIIANSSAIGSGSGSEIYLGWNSPSINAGAGVTIGASYAGGGTNMLFSTPSSIPSAPNVKMTLDGNGNLGLGVTPAAWSAYTVMQITNGGALFAYPNPYEQIGLINNGYFNGSNWIYTNSTSAATRYQQYNGEHLFYTASGGTAGNVISFTQAMTLFSTGNLAVGGTSDNGSRLNVTGAATFSSSVTAGSSILISNTINAYAYQNFGANSGYGWQIGKADNSTGLAPSNGFYFYDLTNSATRMVISQSGNVGIGTTSPAYKLDVLGNIQASDNILIGNGSNAAYGLEVGYGRTTTGSSYVDLIGGDITYQDYGSRFTRESGGANANTGIYHRGTGLLKLSAQDAGDITFETTSIERMRITSGGNVLVGTTTDGGQKLQVNGTTRTTSADIGTTAGDIFISNLNRLSFTGAPTIEGQSSTKPLLIGTVDAQSLVLYTNASERMRITSGGDVGIGTSSPSYKLDVVGVIRSNASGIGTLNLGTDTYSYSNIAGQVIATSSPSYTSSGKLSFKVLTWGVGSDYGPTEQMYIDVTGPDTKSATLVMLPWGGNVGLGTTTPSSILDARVSSGATSGFRFKGWSDSATPYLLSLGTQTYQDIFQIKSVNGLVTMGIVGAVGATPDLAFQTNSSERMRITSGGNVGIGTTSPTPKLDIQGGVPGDAAFGQVYIADTRAYNTSGLGGTISLGATFNSSSGNTYLTSIQGAKENTTDGNYAGAMVFSTRANGAGLSERMRITSGGNVAVGSTNADPLALGRERNLAIVTTGTNAALTIVGGVAGRIDFGVGGTRTAGIYSDVSNFTEIFTTTALPLVFSTNSSERMRITSAGELLINTTSDAGDYKLQVNGAIYGTYDITLNSYPGYGSGSSNFYYNGTDSRFVFNANLKANNGEFNGSIKTAAPSGGTAGAWKLGTYGTAIAGSTGYAIPVEIDGTLYYLMTGYLPEPAPEAAPNAGPAQVVSTRFEEPVMKIKTDSQRVKDLEKEVAELKEMIKTLIKK